MSKGEYASGPCPRGYLSPRIFPSVGSILAFNQGTRWQRLHLQTANALAEPSDKQRYDPPEAEQ